MKQKLGPVPAHIVEPGGTLSGIAKRYLRRPSSWPLLAALNRMPNPHLIRPGDLIALPYGVDLDA